MSHENAALVRQPVPEIFQGTGREPRIWDPSKIAIIFDHRVPAESPKTATNQKKVREFVGRDQGITRFHDIRGDEGGICHQILPENGYVRPGPVVVGTDSHTTSHGALGAFAFGIGATEMASVWALGVALNVEVPPTIKVEVQRRLPGARRPEGPDPPPGRPARRRGRQLPGDRVPRRDHPRHVDLGPADALQHVGRGGRHLRHRPGRRRDGALPARGGGRRPTASTWSCPTPTPSTSGRSTIDVAALAPQIACPHTVDNVKPVDAVEGVKVQQIVIGSCTNGRLDDIAAAARILRGKKVARGTRMLVFPASCAHLPAGDRTGLRRRPDARRRGGDELRLRPLPRRPRGRARRRRGGALDHQPQLQGPHGQPERPRSTSARPRWRPPPRSPASSPTRAREV